MACTVAVSKCFYCGVEFSTAPGSASELRSDTFDTKVGSIVVLPMVSIVKLFELYGQL